jgi:hypothetical protein
MAIVAIPRGVEITKVTKAQERALDKLLKAQRDENTIQTAIKVAIPTLAFVGVAGVGIATTFAYLKDLEIPSVSQVAQNAGSVVANTLLNVLPSPDTPLTPEVTQLGTTLPICKRFEADYVSQNEIRNELPFVGGTLQALAQLDTIRKMKKKWLH